MLNHFEDFLLDVLVVGLLDDFAEFLHELPRGDLIVNQSAAIFDARFHDLKETFI